jgi:hypothetical protein
MEEKVEDTEELEVEVEVEVEVELELEVEVENKNYINIMYGSRNITDNNT